MNDTILFQHILSNSECAEWLALTASITLRYCLRHKIDYRLIMATSDASPGHWEVPMFIREFMNAKYANIIYLDADTVIVDNETDLREAIMQDKVGAVWHNSPTATRDLSHYNVGALYVSNTPRVVEFVDRWTAGKPGKDMSHFPEVWEQGVFNSLGTKMEIIHKLDHKWNATDGLCPSDHPVVWGLHGFPDRIGPIKQYLERSK